MSDTKEPAGEQNQPPAEAKGRRQQAKAPEASTKEPAGEQRPLKPGLMRVLTLDTILYGDSIPKGQIVVMPEHLAKPLIEKKRVRAV